MHFFGLLPLLLLLSLWNFILNFTYTRNSKVCWHFNISSQPISIPCQVTIQFNCVVQFSMNSIYFIIKGVPFERHFDQKKHINIMFEWQNTWIFELVFMKYSIRHNIYCLDEVPQDCLFCSKKIVYLWCENSNNGTFSILLVCMSALAHFFLLLFVPLIWTQGKSDWDNYCVKENYDYWFLFLFIQRIKIYNSVLVFCISSVLWCLSSGLL